ncbi:hypothetical protein MKEN_00361900 [Mycena kentingensis (nom. inval.)]|nr:hypothetical protein MKEN_00361900 [Mycena kentingensis (nom. inval.)]
MSMHGPAQNGGLRVRSAARSALTLFAPPIPLALFSSCLFVIPTALFLNTFVQYPENRSILPILCFKIVAHIAFAAEVGVNPKDVYELRIVMCVILTCTAVSQAGPGPVPPVLTFFLALGSDVTACVCSLKFVAVSSKHRPAVFASLAM